MTATAPHPPVWPGPPRVFAAPPEAPPDFFGEREVAMTATAPQPPVWPGLPDVVAAPSGPPAGFWIRFVAYVIDALILGVGATIAFGIVIALLALLGSNLEDGIVV